MRKTGWWLLSLWCVLWLSQCATVPKEGQIGLLSDVTPAECLEMAECYLNHRWVAGPEQVKHGLDRDGIRVDTPDAGYRPAGRTPGWWRAEPGAVNVGIPYCWGGSDTPESFDEGLRRGKWAGDIYTNEKRRGLESAVSKYTVGADCSGFISRCWKLEWHCSTRTLPRICDELPGYQALQPGDALNTHNGHVLLFAKFTKADGSELLVYETGSPLGWKVTKHVTTADFLKAQGYKPYRYRGMKRG